MVESDPSRRLVGDRVLDTDSDMILNLRADGSGKWDMFDITYRTFPPDIIQLDLGGLIIEQRYEFSNGALVLTDSEGDVERYVQAP